MDKYENVWKANLENGLIMACIGLIHTLLIYFFKLMANPVQGYVLYTIQIAVLFFMLKSFRDKKRGGFISYGQSLGAGMVIFTIYSLVLGLFTFILYVYRSEPDRSTVSVGTGQDGGDGRTPKFHGDGHRDAKNFVDATLHLPYGSF
jgi:hypothetical protein